MSNKILIAVDTSENAMKAVKYAAGILRSDSHVTLFHVFFKLPREDLQQRDFGPHHHVSFSGSTEEFKEWLAGERVAVEETLDRAKKLLIEGGLDPKNIMIKIGEEKQGIATDILNEIKEGGYDTVIMGRRGLSRVKRFFSGSITAKIMHHAEDCTVWIVE